MILTSLRGQPRGEVGCAPYVHFHVWHGTRDLQLLSSSAHLPISGGEPREHDDVPQHARNVRQEALWTTHKGEEDRRFFSGFPFPPKIKETNGRGKRKGERGRLEIGEKRRQRRRTFCCWLSRISLFESRAKRKSKISSWVLQNLVRWWSMYDNDILREVTVLGPVRSFTRAASERVRAQVHFSFGSVSIDWNSPTSRHSEIQIETWFFGGEHSVKSGASASTWKSQLVHFCEYFRDKSVFCYSTTKVKDDPPFTKSIIKNSTNFSPSSLQLEQQEQLTSPPSSACQASQSSCW